MLVDTASSVSYAAQTPGSRVLCNMPRRTLLFSSREIHPFKMHLRHSGGASRNRTCVVGMQKSSAETKGNDGASPDDQLGKNKVNIVGPEPKRFVVAEGELENIGSAAFAALIRGGAGAFNVGYKAAIQRLENSNIYSVAKLGMGLALMETSSVGNFARPESPIEIYDRQNCPKCRIVREAVSLLDLNVLFYPCPIGGNLWTESAGSEKLPIMKDSNSGFSIDGNADEIVSYLFRMYGNRTIPGIMKLPFGLTEKMAALGLKPRASSGSIARPSKAAKTMKPLRLWAYEASPFCVVVREVLSELEIPHEQITVARGSPQRQELLSKVGHFQVPFLEDPNTGIGMFESKAIIDYLNNTYSA